MDRHELDMAVNRQIEQAYWPWWFAVAYVQPKPERYEAMRRGVETFLAFKGSSVDAVGAFGRFIAVLCGEDDPDGETFRIWQSRAEDRLMLAIRAGKITAWGYPAPTERLVELKPSDWVGGEVDCSNTCDLVKEGWRGSGTLSRAVDLERVVRFSDIHLPREQVMAWADHLELEAHATMQSVDDASNSEAFEKIAARLEDLEGGFWSAFVACAWIGSGCEAFTAKAQRFERDEQANRGGIYSAAAWSVLRGALRHRFGVSDKDVLRRLQVAVADRVLSAGFGLDRDTGRSREIAPAEWLRMAVVHDQHGTSLVPGVYGVSWSSADVRAAFPASSLPPLVQEQVAAALSDDEVIAQQEAWAVDAASRCVTITDARKDALRILGDRLAPPQDLARTLLRNAREKAGKPIKRGRPHGSKSFAKS